MIYRVVTILVVIHLSFPFVEIYGQNYDYLRSSTAVDTVITDETGGTNEVASATLDLGASNSKVTKVLVVCSMNMRASGSSSNNREVVYEIRNAKNDTRSGEIVRGIQKKDDFDFGASTLVHIFDVSSISGETTFLLEQYNNLAASEKNVETIGYITAIALNTELNGYEIYSSNKRLAGLVTTSSSTFTTVTGLATDTLILPLKGDVYVAASINCEESGGNSAVGEWVLQYKAIDSTSWTNLGFPSQVTLASNSDNLIVSLVGLVRNLEPSDYHFRVAHRRVSGNGTVGTRRSNIVSVSLNHEGRAYFPSFYSEAEENDTIIGEGSSATLTSTTFTSPVDITGTGPNLLMHTQYVALAHDLENNERALAKHQVFLDNGTEVDTAVGFKRLLADNSDYGAGGFVGMSEDLDGDLLYTVSVKHFIDSLINVSGDVDSMTTSRVVLCGFQTFDQPTYKWDGSTSSNWGTASNWVENEVPVTAGFALIPDVATNDPVFSTLDTITRVGIDSAATLTIENSGRMTIVGDLNVEGTLNIQANADSTGSLIVQGISAGDVNVDSYLTADQWHIVSPPVSTQLFSSFLSNLDNNIPDKSGSYGLTDYDETNNIWGSYFTTSTPGNFTPGQGYLLRRESIDSTVTYAGELTVANLPVTITENGVGWNALGNPYSSALGATSDATTTKNFLTENLAQLDSNFSALYVWDEQPGYTGTRYDYRVIGNSGYVDTLNYTELSRDYLQSGQGFLVKSKTGGGSVTFTTDMRVHEPDKSLLKGSRLSWRGFKLVMGNDYKSVYTILTFHQGMSRGLDPSYDAGIFSSDPEFSVSSRLLSVDEGIDFKIQCLPDLSSEKFVIPISIYLSADSLVTFHIEGNYMPPDYQLYLEDRADNSFTDLSRAGSSFDLYADESLQGPGRIYLHVLDSNSTSPVLEKSKKSEMNAYYINQSIRIQGPVAQGASASLIDLNGKILENYHLSEGELNTISVPSLEDGVYILMVMNGNERTAFKIPIH